MDFGVVQKCLEAAEALKDGQNEALQCELLFSVIVLYAPLKKLLAAVYTLHVTDVLPSILHPNLRAQMTDMGPQHRHGNIGRPTFRCCCRGAKSQV